MREPLTGATPLDSARVALGRQVSEEPGSVIVSDQARYANWRLAGIVRVHRICAMSAKQLDQVAASPRVEDSREKWRVTECVERVNLGALLQEQRSYTSRTLLGGKVQGREAKAVTQVDVLALGNKQPRLLDVVAHRRVMQR
jgi:hypothetical protein